MNRAFHLARQIVWKFLQVCAVGTCLEYRILNSMKMDLAMSMRILVHLIKLAFQLEIMLELVRLYVLVGIRIIYVIDFVKYGDSDEKNSFC